jgi:hypothetical protein
MPGITLEAAERLVREQCPEFRDFDDLLGLNEPAVPSVERPPADAPVAEDLTVLPRRKRRRQVVIVAALLPALAASYALGRYTDIVPTAHGGPAASTPDVTAANDEVEDGPFNEMKFRYFADAGTIDCDRITSLEAECTDADDMVMSNSRDGPGQHHLHLQLRQGAHRPARLLRPGLRQDLVTAGRLSGAVPAHEGHGRYVLWGTDPKRIEDYFNLLVDADRHAGPSAMGSATPLPPRLAALTLGTLRLNTSQVHQILAAPVDAPTAVEAPAVMAARMVLGLAWIPVPVLENDDDIVALAAGIDPKPAMVPPAAGRYAARRAGGDHPADHNPDAAAVDDSQHAAVVDHPDAPSGGDDAAARRPATLEPAACRSGNRGPDAHGPHAYRPGSGRSAACRSRSHGPGPDTADHGRLRQLGRGTRTLGRGRPRRGPGRRPGR